jgi:hypothetical protein
MAQRDRRRTHGHEVAAERARVEARVSVAVTTIGAASSGNRAPGVPALRTRAATVAAVRRPRHRRAMREYAAAVPMRKRQGRPPWGRRKKTSTCAAGASARDERPAGRSARTRGVKGRRSPARATRKRAAEAKVPFCHPPHAFPAVVADRGAQPPGAVSGGFAPLRRTRGQRRPSRLLGSDDGTRQRRDGGQASGPGGFTQAQRGGAIALGAHGKRGGRIHGHELRGARCPDIHVGGR